MKSIYRALFTLLFFSSIAKAAPLTTEFIQQYQVVLAQFIASERISQAELRDLDFTLAVDRDSGAQFFLVYRPAIGESRPRYYYLIDRKMKASAPMLNFGDFLDDGIISATFLPDWVVDDSVKIKVGKKVEVDAMAYFGEIDPVEVRLYNLRTENGYEIHVEHYSHHRPGADILGTNETTTLEYLRDNYPEHFKSLMESKGFFYRPSYYATGNIKPKDLLSPEARATRIASEQLVRISQQSSPEYKAAFFELAVRVNTFIGRYNNLMVLEHINRLLRNSKSKGSSSEKIESRCKDLMGSLSF